MRHFPPAKALGDGANWTFAIQHPVLQRGGAAGLELEEVDRSGLAVLEAEFRRNEDPDARLSGYRTQDTECGKHLRRA